MKKNLANQELRAELKGLGIPLWRLAHQIGICDGSIQRWFRVALEGEHREKVLKALEELKEGSQG